MATSKSKTSGHRSGGYSSGSGAGSAASKTRTSKSTVKSKTGHVTIDHEEIRKWAEARRAHPACVKGTGRRAGDTGMIRLDFPGFSGEESLQPISWDEWFRAFENHELALIYQEKTAGGRRSNFNKLISRHER